jgi:hypothetical protein
MLHTVRKIPLCNIAHSAEFKRDRPLLVGGDGVSGFDSRALAIGAHSKLSMREG